ncbi:MAG: hypothetical protein JST54_14010 [Deltaproteobacteria bacterium]|nr:hypothetical protein [Deltaproteobacteria bacterium]
MRRLALLALALAGCLYPVNPDSDCRARVDACLKNCAPPPPTATPVQPTSDARTPCERDCEALCH